MTDYNTMTGTPQSIQNQGAPTTTWALTDSQLAYFNQGGLLFFWDRLNSALYFLQFIDPNTNLQTWTLFPTDMDTLLYIGILPVLQSLYWLVAAAPPTSSETLNPIWYNGSFGILWYDNVDGNVFKMTSFDAGSGTQVWTQLV